MMTYKEILETALRQSAKDSGCSAHDFLAGKNTVVRSVKNESARKYLELPFILDLTSYGSGIVASVSEGYEEIAREYINSYTEYHCFETPNLHVLSSKLRSLGADICFMAEYWLPRPEKIRHTECGFETRGLGRESFENLYLPQWSNALCKQRKHLDMIAVGAYEDNKLIALAGASADCEDMWQIGIDVLPKYRRRGIATALTGILATEIMKCGKVPFYCCAWSNVASARNAVASGFVPAWVQITAKKTDFIDKINYGQRI